MAQVANLSAKLDANTGRFNSKLSKARRDLRNTGRDFSRSARRIDNSVSGAFKNAARNVAAFQGPLGGVAGRLSTLGAIFSSGNIAAAGFSLAIAGASVALKRAADEGAVFERSQLRIQALLKATGGASGLTARDIREFSRELARSTLASAQGAEAAAAKLLTFKSVSGDAFRRTLTLAQDLAEVLGTDLRSSVLQLGQGDSEKLVLLVSSDKRDGLSSIILNHFNRPGR